MKKLLFIISIIALPLMVQGQWYGGVSQNKQAEVTYKDSSGFYVIKFVYNDSFCTVPLTNPLGCDHYSASITVYEVTNGDTVAIGKPFGGTYTAGKCYEDEPGGLIAEAKKLRDKQVESDKLGEALKADTTGLVWETYKAGQLVKFGIDSISPAISTAWNGLAVLGSTNTLKPVYDTIPVIMLVCDTAPRQSIDPVFWVNERDRIRNEQPVFWLRGYEVRKVSQYWISASPGSFVEEKRNRYDHIAYLDSNKKPVEYLVWDRKEVGK